MSSPEKINFGHEIKGEKLEEVEKTGEELREKLEKGREAHEIEDNAHEKEKALHEALNEATDKKPETTSEKPREASPAERRNKPIKAELDASFNTTMSEIRSQMSEPSRAFSKLIHNKAVEKVSDVAGSTIARPNAILAGAVCAFLLTLGVYLVAKNFGYPLSGFETIGAFILGWILGVVYDFLRVMITGRSS